MSTETSRPSAPQPDRDTSESGGDEPTISSGTFQAAIGRSAAIWADLPANPQRYRVLTGDRPTGSLHIGHLFGSLDVNRTAP